MNDATGPFSVTVPKILTLSRTERRPESIEIIVRARAVADFQIVSKLNGILQIKLTVNQQPVRSRSF